MGAPADWHRAHISSDLLLHRLRCRENVPRELPAFLVQPLEEEDFLVRRRDLCTALEMGQRGDACRPNESLVRARLDHFIHRQFGIDTKVIEEVGERAKNGVLPFHRHAVLRHPHPVVSEVSSHRCCSV